MAGISGVIDENGIVRASKVKPLAGCRLRVSFKGERRARDRNLVAAHYVPARKSARRAA